MFCYILSSAECAVKLNGKYSGKCSGNYFVFECEETLIELVPLDNERLPVAYLFEKGAESTPNMKVYDLKNGYLLLPVFSRRAVTDFKMIGRGKARFSVGTVSVACYGENGVKLVVETERDAYIESLPFLPAEARFEKAEGGSKEYLVCFFIGERTLVTAFEIGEGITLAFRRVCDAYTFEPPILTLTENKNDILKHTVFSSWKFGEKVFGVETEIRRKRQIYAVEEKLLPYCFFEEILIGGDAGDFLTPAIKPRADELKGFLGNFTAVLPPPHFVNQNYQLLLYADKVEYAEVTLSGGLISNVSLHEV